MKIRCFWRARLTAVLVGCGGPPEPGMGTESEAAGRGLSMNDNGVFVFRLTP